MGYICTCKSTTWPRLLSAGHFV